MVIKEPDACVNTVCQALFSPHERLGMRLTQTMLVHFYSWGSGHVVGQNNLSSTLHLFLLQLHFLPFSSSSAVTIGFDATSYTITESTNSVSVSVSVQGSTTLDRDVIVTVETMDGTATGGAVSHILANIVHVSFMFYHSSLQLHLTTQLCPWT